MYIDRHIKKVLKKRFSKARSLYLFGARQTGKTTLVKKTFSNLPYKSLEDPDVFQFAKNDPRGFLELFPNGAILDEVQRAPELFSYLQSIIDEKEIKFVLTGSQNFLLMENVTQTLAGRISLLELPTLSFRESERKNLASILDLSKDHLSEYEIDKAVLNGGYPEVVSDPEKRDYWFDDYERTYVERDVRQVLNVQNIATFQRFIRLCAGRSGSLLNYSSIAVECGISESSCRNWINILQISGLVTLLQPYFRNFNKRIIKSPKLFFNDTGLLCNLLGIRNEDMLRLHPLRGHIIETFIVSEIKKGLNNSGLPLPLYFYRTSRGDEVDVIIENGPELIAVEIKSGKTIKQEFLKGLLKFREFCNDEVLLKSICLYGGDDRRVENEVEIVPWYSL